MKKLNKGFTLIELLVVIAIIGILSSVVLVSLNTARKKASDTRVIASVQQLRTLLESDFSTNYNASFVEGSCSIATDTSCALNASGDYQTLQDDIIANGGTLTVVSTRGAGPSVTAYALYGRLVSNTANYFCIASNGSTQQVSTDADDITCDPTN